MKLFIESEPMEEIQKLKPKSLILQKKVRWTGLEVDTSAIHHDDFALIKSVMEKEEFWKDIKNRRVFKHLEALEKVLEQESSQVKVKKLETLPDIIKMRMADTEHRWVFERDDSYDADFPYFVKSTRFHPAEKYRPAHVTVNCVAIRRGKEKTLHMSFDRTDLRGGKQTVDSLFDKKGVLVETPEQCAAYFEEMEKYEEWNELTGEQFKGSGKAVNLGEYVDVKDHDGYYWGSRYTTMEHEGLPSNLVMDDSLKYGDDSITLEVSDWSNIREEEVDLPEDEDELEEMLKDSADDIAEKVIVELPLHPNLMMFNLKTHNFVKCHVSKITPYVYDNTIGDKLVLPDEHRELADALTSSAIHYMEDIVAGKAAGVIIMCSGEPGTGKTLTAEVYAEKAERPLYTVQCSQLGTDEKALERNLQTVLDRAYRWRAILLIDESDVYLHERGENIHQNAIVGVWLRLLEYHKGMMFLTTNLGTVIDDAIVSRLTAHLKYRVPKGDGRHKIWKILAPNFRVEMDDAMIAEAVETFPNISGRSIRQLLKLSSFVAAHRQKKVGMDIIKHASKFHDFSEEERKGMATF